MRIHLLALALMIGSGAALGATAQEQDPAPSRESLEKAFSKRAVREQRPYSPYSAMEHPTHVYWGDTHLHTAYSLDAGAFGARLGPRDAYRFARGEEVMSSTGHRCGSRARSTSSSSRTTPTTWASFPSCSPAIPTTCAIRTGAAGTR